MHPEAQNTRHSSLKCSDSKCQGRERVCLSRGWRGAPVLLGTISWTAVLCFPLTDKMATTNSISKANVTFALSFFKKLAEANRAADVFLSPFSVSAALAMVMLGARGSTAGQMSKVKPLRLVLLRLDWPSLLRRLCSFSQVVLKLVCLSGWGVATGTACTLTAYSLCLNDSFHFQS